MTLPASGAISFNNVATELGIGQSGFSISSPIARDLAGIPTGVIRLSNFYGKTRRSMTAGRAQIINDEYIGYETGGANIGSINNVNFIGRTIIALYNHVNLASIIMVLSGTGSSNAFPKLVIDGKTYLTSAATFYADATYSAWQWPAQSTFVNSQNYTIGLF
jgi:hypothetical protein